MKNTLPIPHRSLLIPGARTRPGKLTLRGWEGCQQTKLFHSIPIQDSHEFISRDGFFFVEELGQFMEFAYIAAEDVAGLGVFF